MRRATRITLVVVAALALIAPSVSPALASPEDLADEVFYHFMPIAWRDSDSDIYRFGDFGGMTESLDYLETLGVTAVWMNPIFPSPAYHGYQHGDASQLNAWFGDESDLTAFVEAAHDRGIKVFVDMVAYGISHDSIWFQDAYGNPLSPYDTWLAFTNDANTEYWGSQYKTWNGDQVGFIHWDLRDSGPVSLVTQWAQHWLDPNGDEDFSDGLDGYRLDHVWVYYPGGPDGWGYNLESFWIPWHDALRSVNPDVTIFAEQADWGIHGEELFPAFDAAFTKPLEFAVRSALQSEWASGLYSEMASTVAAEKSAQHPGTFMCTIGNHDVDRLASTIGDSFEKGKAAAAILLTQPYAPVIYHGDEIGMRGVKHGEYPGDAADIPMREPFKWNAIAGPPMTNYFILSPPAYNGRYARDNDGRSVEEQLDVPGSQLEAYRELIAVRRGNVALRRGGYAPVVATSGNVWAFVRHHEDQQVLVIINLRSSGDAFTLDLSGFEIPGGSTTPKDLISGGFLPPITDANKTAYPVTLGAYDYFALDVDVTPPEALVDGREIPSDFGETSLVATQDNGTGLGDNVSELNQLFLVGRGDSCMAGLTGNLATDGTGLALLLDTRPGGQNVLDFSGYDPPPSGPHMLTGTRLDVGFEPDHMIFVNAFGGTIYLDQFELLSGGGVVKTYRGSGGVNSGDGTLSGGYNPNHMQLALDNTNTEGVTETDPSGAATATTGFEAYLPFADVDLPGEEQEVGVAAFLMLSSGVVSNQWLPGLGGGYGNLGFTPDMTQIPGDQFARVDLDSASSAGDVVDGLMDLRTPSLNTGHSQVAFTFSLPEAGTMRLSVLDVRGRLVRTLYHGSGRTGEQTIPWNLTTGAGLRVSAGVYFGRLEWRGRVDVERVVIVR